MHGRPYKRSCVGATPWFSNWREGVVEGSAGSRNFARDAQPFISWSFSILPIFEFLFHWSCQSTNMYYKTVCWMCSISDQARHHLWETLNLVQQWFGNPVCQWCHPIIACFSYFDISLSTMSVCVIWLFWLLCRAALLELPSLLVGKRSHVFWLDHFLSHRRPLPARKEDGGEGGSSIKT